MKKLLVILIITFKHNLIAQNILGKVINYNDEPLFNTSVFFPNTSISTTTDINGNFKITTKDIPVNFLVASHVGYSSDTIEITNQRFIEFRLDKLDDLEEIIIKDKRDGIIISNLKPIKFEQITQTELEKSACCDLSGCFETQSSVQPQTTNIITNSKELRILGLSGVYNQVLIDGFPIIQGLTYTYGISSIPGTLVANIFVSKGANSILQGFESISGQINVETKEPDKSDKLLLNTYINNFSEKHYNANYSFQKQKLRNITAIHIVRPAKKYDRDNDDFLDLPLLNRYMLFNKLKYGNKENLGWHSQLSFRYLNEQRIGGQTIFNKNSDIGSNQVYGQIVNISQPEIGLNSTYMINDFEKIILSASSFYQDQESCFGLLMYDALQKNFYSNIQYELIYGKNSLKTGFSFRFLNLDENISFTDNDFQRSYGGNYLRRENITGVFAENSIELFNDRFTWIGGIRLDNHDQFGVIFTPRSLIKYDITPNSVIRTNIGTGWRTVNLFSENIRLLLSSRDIIFEEQLEPEKALNLGVNFTHKFNTENVTGFFSTDYYHTDFQNQIFPDYDVDPKLVIIENYKGKSISKTFQTEVYLNISGQFEFKTGYSFLDVYREIDSKKVILPFNPKHKVVTTFGYQSLSDKFHVDINFHFYGKQKLPNTQDNPLELQRPNFSENYILANMQLTYNLKNYEVYIGCENIFDFRQEQPIISWQDPFSEFFDTSSVWGPTRGREIYIGTRLKLPSN